ncbi:MAG: kinase [Deltaproteobacteria bacterium]|nr:kinase [Deltaproteobacteria bacterium]
MIITKTPLRISFLGGGTDYPAWYEENHGAVLATTIDKYCYISCRYLPPFFKHKSRIVYSKTELVGSIDEIQHPSARECLRFMNIRNGVEVHHDADLPARAGLGSSSAFTVGLLHALNALNGKIATKEQLGFDAIHVEQKMIQENVGSQDQILAAHGGFNHLRFMGRNKIDIASITIDPSRLKEFHSHLLLLFTGFSRTASHIASAQILNMKKTHNELCKLYEMVKEGIKILGSKADIQDFGKLLHEGWMIKRSLSQKITFPMIDEIYSEARKAGALGGKLLGAGGGGFMLLFAQPSNHEKIQEKLRAFLHVPFQFENDGSKIIFYKPY